MTQSDTEITRRKDEEKKSSYTPIGVVVVGTTESIQNSIQLTTVMTYCPFLDFGTYVHTSLQIGLSPVERWEYCWSNTDELQVDVSDKLKISDDKPKRPGTS